MSFFKKDKYTELKKELNKLSDAMGKASEVSGVFGDFYGRIDEAENKMKSKGNKANSICTSHFTKALGLASRLFSEHAIELEKFKNINPVLLKRSKNVIVLNNNDMKLLQDFIVICNNLIVRADMERIENKQSEELKQSENLLMENMEDAIIAYAMNHNGIIMRNELTEILNEYSNKNKLKVLEKLKNECMVEVQGDSYVFTALI